MMIAVPVDETKEALCLSFGRAPYVLFYDTEREQGQVRENPAAQSEGGAGIQAAQFVVDGGAQALVTVRCGENAAQVLQAAEIAIYKAQGGAREALEALKEGKLPRMTTFHAGFHGIR